MNNFKYYEYFIIYGNMFQMKNIYVDMYGHLYRLVLYLVMHACTNIYFSIIILFAIHEFLILNYLVELIGGLKKSMQTNRE
jgi:hypothetical protein